MKTLFYTFFSVVLILGIIVTAYILSSNSLIEKNKASSKPILGHVDYAGCTNVKGWAWDPATPDAPLKVYLYFDNYISRPTPDMQMVADYERNDIKALITDGSGRNGFEFAMPPTVKDGRAHLVYIYAIDFTDPSRSVLIPGSPSTIVCK